MIQTLESIPTPFLLLLVVGGTGFLGKVWWAFLLSRFPDVERIYLVMRPKGGASVEERYLKDIEPSAVLDPLRTTHGAGFTADKATW